jgi:general L-amino acid transport system substrate-binding protein
VRRIALTLAIAGTFAIAAPTAAQDASPTPTPTPSPPPAPTGTLATVIDRGQLVCGVNGNLPGFSFLDQGSGEVSGFDADFCRAIAAAVLGDPDAVEFRALNTQQRGPALQTGEVDVLIRNTTWTVSRDTSWGLFAPTTFYDSQDIMVRTEDAIKGLADLDGATVCVQSGTTTELNLTDAMTAVGASFEPLVFADIDPTYAAYDAGSCDAVTSDRSQLAVRRTTLAEPDAHALLGLTLSKEPLGPVVPLGDDQWFNVVKWVVFATFQAEESGITQANVQDMLASEDPVIQRLLGVQGGLGSYLALPEDWVVNVITAVGNYGEIFDRNLGPGTPFQLDRGLNRQWTDGGLLYAAPYR